MIEGHDDHDQSAKVVDRFQTMCFSSDGWHSQFKVRVALIDFT